MPLDQPGSPEDLYRYQQPVPVARPLMQGDVFLGAELPGFDEAQWCMILTHPCSMRMGAAVRDRLLVTQVRPVDTRTSWQGNYRRFPLPHLIGVEADSDQSWEANFEELHTVSSSTLDVDRRIACLDDLGILLLQQRLIHHLTRVEVSKETLFKQCAHVLAVAELLEDWIDELAENASDSSERAVLSEEFDDMISSHRARLRHESERASVRRWTHEQIRLRRSAS